MLDFEKKYWSNGISNVIGIDEVGRGPLCGPVVSAAVVFPAGLEIPEINDSKKLSPKKRAKLYDVITKEAISIGLGVVHEDQIDQINILNATILSMKKAVDALTVSADILLVDGNLKKISTINQESIVKGDSKSQSIAAASIIAKVTRDRMMEQYDKVFPGYGFSRNMGYGTREHIDALKDLSSTPIHRQSFKPVSTYMPTFKDIKDIPKLSVQIAAAKLVQSGHQILSLNYEDSDIHILSSKDNDYHGFILNDDKEGIKKNEETIKVKAIASLKELLSKKDTTHSIIISVISVQLSKDKPKVIFKNI